LKRICLSDDATTDEVIVKTSGLWGLLRPNGTRRADAQSGGRRVQLRASL